LEIVSRDVVGLTSKLIYDVVMHTAPAVHQMTGHNMVIVRRVGEGKCQ